MAAPVASPRSLRAACLDVLATPDVAAKGALAVAMAADWAAGRLTLALAPGELAAAPQPPARPARPLDVIEADPRKTKGGSKLKFVFHALVHAESYAIDLAVDLMARFGWAPETWTLPPGERGGGDDARGDEAAAAGRDADVAVHVLACVGSGGGGDVAQAPAAHLPAAFFDDWVAVAAQEGEHMAGWRARLAAAGGEYGDYPAHDSLWESAADTSYSLAARLAVVHCVHEARGLDTAPALAARLAAGGDAASGALLAVNVAQEGEHVAKGVRWLRWLAEDAGGRAPAAVPRVFRDLARRHFRGVLRPPFNEAARDGAGLTRDWWGPLAAAAGGEGAGGGAARGET